MTTVATDPATPATADDSGPASVLLAVRVMGGSDRLSLLEWLCGSHPATVAAGVATLAAERSAARARRAETERVRRNRRSTLRHRRKRREARAATT